MPYTPAAVIVEPDGNTVSVTIRRNSATGQAVSAYTAENGSSLYSLPKVVTSQTAFWLASGGVYYVSLVANGQECYGRTVDLGGYGRASVAPEIVDQAEDLVLTVTGDGTTDVTTVIQAAIDTAYANGGGDIRLPTGTFLVSSLMLYPNVALRGAGKLATILTAKTGATEKGLITIAPGPAKRTGVYDLMLTGNAANTSQWGIYADAVADSSTTGGWWYSDIERLTINEFVPGAIWLRGGGTGGLLPHQFLRFHGITAKYQTPGNTAWVGVRMTGQVGQVTVEQCEFTGSAAGESASGVYVSRHRNAGDTDFGDDTHPYSIHFDTTTFQNVAIGARVDRANGMLFSACYWEDNKSGILAEQSAGPVTVLGPRFADSCSDGASTGYAAKVSGTSYMMVDNPYVNGAVDADVWQSSLDGRLSVRAAHPTNQLVAADISDAGWINGSTHPNFLRHPDGKLEWASGSAVPDTNLSRSSAGVLNCDQTIQAVRFAVNGTAGNGKLQFNSEQATPPSAPSANACVLYIQDNGAGKTQLMAMFSSGAAQQVAIQP